MSSGWKEFENLERKEALQLRVRRIDLKQLTRLLGVFGIAVAASASTIDFNGLTGPYLSSYSENGYTVTSIAGVWDVSQTIGNPAPSVSDETTGTLQITGGYFTFQNIDIVNEVAVVLTGAYTFTITGMFQGQTVLSQTTSAVQSFTTINSVDPTQSLDTLDISVNFMHQGIDNISLGTSSVPEPGTMALTFGGLALVGWRMKVLRRALVKWV